MTNPKQAPSTKAQCSKQQTADRFCHLEFCHCDLFEICDVFDEYPHVFEKTPEGDYSFIVGDRYTFKITRFQKRDSQ